MTDVALFPHFGQKAFDTLPDEDTFRERYMSRTDAAHMIESNITTFSEGEAAEELGVSISFLIGERKAGRIACFKAANRRYRYTAAQLADWIASRTVPVAEPEEGKTDA